MRTTWVLVADSARARLFEISAEDRSMTELGCYASAASRSNARDSATDRLPRTSESVGEARHAIEPHTTLRDKSSNQFAHVLGDVLKGGHAERRFERLVLVAPARFLGILNATLDKGLRGCLAGELPRDLVALPVPEIRARLSQAMLA
jgi:protein required for attachment to host cells